MPKLPGLPYVRSGVTEGLSANQAFRNYQAAARQATEETGDTWTASNRSAFLQLYSATRLSRSKIGDALSAPRDSPSGGLTPTPRPTVRATGYGNWAVIFHRVVGSSEIDQFFYNLRSDQPLTPAEVEARALADFEAASTDVHGTTYRSVVVGVMWTGTDEYVPTEGL